MTLKALFAAALIFAAGAVPVTVATPAEAQARTLVTERTTVRTSGPRYRETRRVAQRRYNGRRAATRRVCTNRYRNGRSIRTCRNVRRYR